MELIVTIIRHGDTFAAGAPVRRIGARTDLPLVASGIDQARALADDFARRGVAVDRALTGPLARTRATMAVILSHLRGSPAPEIVDWLTEIDHGPDEGQHESDVIARIGRDALAVWEKDMIAPDGWTADEPYRVQNWHRLLTTGHGHVLIVTSAGAARFALRADAGLKAQAAGLGSTKLRTGAYGVITRDHGALRLIDWNRRP